jgi:NTP pyrophosphatase (non-canonical NTP hydrolase)
METKKFQTDCELTDRTPAGYDQLISYLGPRDIRLIHMAMGISGEAGELVDAIKKSVFYRKDLDVENVKEELGDILWYMSNLLNELGSSYEEIMARNHEKLIKRYNGQFSELAAVERKDKQ